MLSPKAGVVMKDCHKSPFLLYCDMGSAEKQRSLFLYWIHITMILWDFMTIYKNFLPFCALTCQDYVTMDLKPVFTFGIQGVIWKLLYSLTCGNSANVKTWYYVLPFKACIAWPLTSISLPWIRDKNIRVWRNVTINQQVQLHKHMSELSKLPLYCNINDQCHHGNLGSM